jgi:hypothetical protein
MPALIEVRLVAPSAAARIVVERLKFRQARRRCEPVVGGDDHERVVGESGAVEGVEEPADVGIDLGDEVAVGGRAGAPLERGCRQQRRVRCRQWEVEKERPTVAGLRPASCVIRRAVATRSPLEPAISPSGR